MEEIINIYCVAEIGRTTYGGKPIYANITYGDNAYDIEDATTWCSEEYLVQDMKKFLPDRVYRIRHVEDTIKRVID